MGFPAFKEQRVGTEVKRVQLGRGWAQGLWSDEDGSLAVGTGRVGREGWLSDHQRKEFSSK